LFLFVTDVACLKYPGTYSENFDKSFYDLFMISTAKLLACKVASLLVFLLVISGSQVLSISMAQKASATLPSGSIQFNGNSTLNYVATAVAPSGNGSTSATIEFWMKPPSNQSTGCCSRVLSQQFGFSDSSNPIIIRYGGGPSGAVFFLTVANRNTYSSITPTKSEWNHIAAVSELGTWKLYVNGALSQTIDVNTIGSSTALTNTNFSLGGSWDSGGERFSGQISNFRYVRGSALYTAPFTPSRIALTAVSGTELLLSTAYDGTLTTAQLDGSATPRTPSVNGSPAPTASNDTPILLSPEVTDFTVPTLSYGVASTLSATSNVPGTFTFRDGTTAICSNVVQNGSNTSTCNYTPDRSSAITFTVDFIPTSASYASLTNQRATPVTPSKAVLNVVPANINVAFGGTPSYAFSYTGFLNSENSSTSSFTTGLIAPTCSASSYSTSSVVSALPLQITCSGGSATNYTFNYSSTSSLTIVQAVPTFSDFGNVPKNFGDSAFTVTAPTVTGSVPGTFTYSSGTTSVISVSGTTLTVAGAGTSLITATFTPTDTANYVSGGTIAMTVAVDKYPISITASSHTVAYGAAVPEITPTYSGFVNGDTSSVVTAPTCSTTYTPTTAVGLATSSCNGATATNYSFTYTTGVITITQGGQTNALTINSTSGTYGSTLSLTTLGGNGGGNVSFSKDSGSCTISGTTLTPTAVGTCMVTATKAANGNYLEASSVSTAITINPKGLTVSGLTGVNKEFDRSLTGTVTGTPTLVGVVGSDDVLLGGTPTFTFASANAANGITVTASGYTLTGTTASNYTLTQPTVTANITAKAARVAATNTTVAFGAPVTSGVTATGLVSPDAIGSASYTYTGTGTSTPPTAVGVYTVTPSSAVLSTGTIGNYTISYDTATVTILAKYTITYNANGGVIASSSTTTVDFVVGDNALTLPTPTRANYTFTGWHTLQSNGVQVTGPYTPTATATLWAHWVQNSLYGMGANTKILTITTLAGVGNTYSANAGGGTVAIEYLADALAAGTVIDAYVLSDTTTATSLIGSGNDYVMSLVLAWVHPITGLVETTAAGKPIIMTITNSVIKKGAKIYSVIGVTPTLLTTATTNGSAIISITDDPQIIIAITKPDAPTGVSATSGGNASTTVSWTAPSDGGSAITGYTATSNAGQTCSSATTSCSITGLTNGTAYTFTVTATNSIGISDPSAPSSAITPVAPAAPVVAPQTSGGGGGGGYVAPAPEPAPTVDPAVAAAAAAAAKALAEKVAAEEKAVAEAKAAADAKALADKKAAEEAELAAIIKALQEQAAAEAAAKRVQEELAAAQLKAEEELAAAAALKLAEEQRIAAALAESKKITTVYSTSAAFKLNKTYTNRLNSYTKRIAPGSTVTCIGYAMSSKNTSYAKAKSIASTQAKALCSSIKKITPTLKTKSIVYPASKAPKTTVNKKWIPVSYRVAVGIN
jgi:uncharacterized repeat protein (TIGR02543 family)